MSTVKERRYINAALDSYREKLDTIPDDQFAETPPGGGWSYAEVYSHILQATLGSSIALERCTHGSCPPTKAGVTWEGRLLLLMGMFPPVKVKIPDAVSDKMVAAKISKEDAKNLIIKCRKRMDTTAPLIDGAPAASRYKHPRLGMLNARQWFRFIRIHLEHHLKQLERIKNKLSQA
ncbi:DinB family protein [Mucilaginibacter ginsenosidivorax]|uniref:DinB family protein n=1 Tax=Mucilaginibacter ginsenosidivorax TaxID=862126 RepID=A0A5B8W2G6_9SPHI|nr:DinB family protein [Mucilaginibacter ginsenosidivorax]QEC77699.1 DinB family protein [Mucilaginibacter ginsenosidivorax]